MRELSTALMVVIVILLCHSNPMQWAAIIPHTTVFTLH